MRLVFANAPTAMYAVTRRGSITLPHQSFPMSAAENPDYAAELADLGQLAREREVWFVWYIPTSAITDYMAPEADMLAALRSSSWPARRRCGSTGRCPTPRRPERRLGALQVRAGEHGFDGGDDGVRILCWIDEPVSRRNEG
ncbi:MAG: hypothetical protein R2699_16315 [Acidimicrobiales bacterium]